MTVPSIVPSEVVGSPLDPRAAEAPISYGIRFRGRLGAVFVGLIVVEGGIDVLLRICDVRCDSRPLVGGRDQVFLGAPEIAHHLDLDLMDGDQAGVGLGRHVGGRALDRGDVKKGENAGGYDERDCCGEGGDQPL